MEGIALNERIAAGSLLKSRSQDEVMSDIDQFKYADIYNCVSETGKADGFGALVFNMERGVNLDEICEFLQDSPDVQPFDFIFANELDDGCSRSGNKNTAFEIAKRLGLNYAWGLEFIELADQSDEKGFHGNVVFSKWPIVQGGVIRLPEQYNWYFDRQKRIGGRLAVYAEVQTEKGRIALISVHLENRTDSEGRKLQMEAVLKFAENEFKDIPVIIGGDLNTNTFDGRDKEMIKRIVEDTELQRICLEDVYDHEDVLPLCAAGGYEIVPKEACITRRKHMPDGGCLNLKLDWIMLKGFAADSVRVISTSAEDFYFTSPGSCLARFEGKELSDHNAVWAQCILK